MRLIVLTANPDLATYDAEAASGYILQALENSSAASLPDVVALFRAAPDEVQKQVQTTVDIGLTLQRAAEAGSVNAAYEYAMLLRERARLTADLGRSANWLQQAAERGHRDAMYEYGYAIGFGLGRPADPAEALLWLDQAGRVGHPKAAETAHVLRVKSGL
ncbi:tetratricopeptide repeat protein [Sulfitobacter aestuariivivens]